MDTRELSQDVQAKLRALASLLSSLPASIPVGQAHYYFTGFSPSEDDVDLYGTKVAALNRTLEVTFCPQGRTEGNPIRFEEQGPGLVDLTFTLEKYLTLYPSESALLMKWVDDLTEAAEAAGGQRDNETNVVCYAPRAKPFINIAAAIILLSLTR